MRLYKLLLSFYFLSFALISFAQKKSVRYFDNPILTDSNSTIMIPTRYDADFLATNKITIFADFYANILFYDIKTESIKKLFGYDTYISGFPANVEERHISKNWIFYLVKNSDRNNNGKIDVNDPTILYVTDRQGNRLTQITAADESVISIHLFDKQSILLIKMQQDSDKDLDFETSDNDYYLVKLNLKTLTLGKKIESK